jgi:hypothetical protein
MGAWSGGAYDSKRDRLIIWGGGHGDYAGNEIYAFDINTLAWQRIWGPTPRDQITDGAQCVETYPDGNPASRHTYDGMIYLPDMDKLWAAGGSLWCGAGGGSRVTWLFDFPTLTWQRRATFRGNGVSEISDRDQQTGHVFVASDIGTFGEYNIARDTWTSRMTVGVGEEMSAAIDPVTRQYVFVGNGVVKVVDLKNWNYNKAQVTTGGAAVVNARGPALIYDPMLKKIVGWGGGSSVYSLDTRTWQWTEHPATNSVIPAGDPARLLVFSKFQYIPSRNAYVVVNRIDDNVFFYRLSSGTGTTP